MAACLHLHYIYYISTAPDAVREVSVMSVKGLEVSKKTRTGCWINTVWRF